MFQGFPQRVIFFGFYQLFFGISVCGTRGNLGFRGSLPEGLERLCFLGFRFKKFKGFLHSCMSVSV